MTGMKVAQRHVAGHSPAMRVAALTFWLVACAGTPAPPPTSVALLATCTAIETQVLARTHVEADWNAARDEIRAACDQLRKYAE